MNNDVTILGISGPSSSGKTTLARLLRTILAAAGHITFILHEDDFYVTDKEIPIHSETGLQDWDCLEAIDAKAFETALGYIKKNGKSPPEFESKEDQNSVGKVDISEALISKLKAQAKELPGGGVVVIIDGFLLYPPALQPVYSLMDVKLFLPLSKELMISRRAARSGYVTLEGFWEDPPGYVDKVVWPNYAKDHAFLFKGKDVQGELDMQRLSELGIQASPTLAEQDMSECLKWAWNILDSYLQPRSNDV